MNKIIFLIIILIMIKGAMAANVGVITFMIQGTVRGTEENVITEGISNLSITVGGNSTNGTFSGMQEVLFYADGRLLINFTHNFSTSNIDLRKVTIKLTSTSLLVNFSGQLKYNKTIYIDNNNFVGLCIKDAEVSNISEITTNCNYTNETDFTACLGNKNGITINGITCTDESRKIKIENLRYSAVRGIQATSTNYWGVTFMNGSCTYNWTCTEWSGCLNGVQTRACSNLGSCVDNKGKPVESQLCTLEPITPTNITPPTIPTKTPEKPTVPAITPAPTIPLGLGAGITIVIAISIIIIAIIIKKRKQKRVV